MEQRAPFVSQYSVLRMSPLTKAVSARSAPAMTEQQAKSAAAKADVHSPNAKGNSGVEVDAKPDPTEAEIETAKAAAANGDQSAIDWLNALRVGVAGAGAVAGGVALHGALRNRNRAKTSGVSGEAVDVKVAPSATSRDVAVHITPHELMEPNAGYLDNPMRRVGSSVAPRVENNAVKALRTIRRLPR